MGMTDYEELKGPALRTFFRLAQEWSLSERDQSILLGEPDAAALALWRRGDFDLVGTEVLVRISLLLGIYRALHTVFSDRSQANAWVSRVQVAGLFKGTSALAHMLDEGMPGMRCVHDRVFALLD